jgi:serine/threonine-protein kinase
MAAVYGATHRNGNRVALKILHLDLSRDENVRTRFLREGYVSNAVGHPGAVRILDDDIAEDGAAFLVMELLEGESLENRRRSGGGKMPVAEVLDIADQLLDVIAVAHDKGIVHRDLKPENVFLTKSGAVKVLDFGVARIWDAARSSETTRTGALLGTPGFMSPEAALGKRGEVDGRSDLWSIGATIFTLLSGEHVHEVEAAHAQLLAAATRPARPLASICPQLPRSVHSVVDRALAFEREERWQDARAMREALRWAAMSARTGPTSGPSFRSKDDERTAFDPDALSRAARSVPESDNEITAQRAAPVRPPRPAGRAADTGASAPHPADAERATPAHTESPTLSDAYPVDMEPSGTAPTYQPTVSLRERPSRVPLIAAFLAAAIGAFAVYFAVRGRRTRVLTRPTPTMNVEATAAPLASEAPLAPAATALPAATLELDSEGDAASSTALATGSASADPSAGAAIAVAPPVAPTAIPVATSTAPPPPTAAAVLASDTPRPRAKKALPRPDASVEGDESTGGAATASVDASSLVPARFEDDGADAGASP